jgi:hypothetical protein
VPKRGRGSRMGVGTVAVDPSEEVAMSALGQ